MFGRFARSISWGLVPCITYHAQSEARNVTLILNAISALTTFATRPARVAEIETLTLVPCALRPLEGTTAACRLIGDTTAWADPHFYRPHMLMLRVACLPSHDPGASLDEALGVIGLRMFRGDIVTVTIVSAVDPQFFCWPWPRILNYLDASEQGFEWSAS
jgi:hypothetical protein